VLGATIAITGVATATAMARFRAQFGHTEGASLFLVLTLSDIIDSVFFSVWRSIGERNHNFIVA
jgi:hypothetical protein